MIFQAVNTKYIKASVVTSIVNLFIQVSIFIFHLQRLEEVKGLRKEGLTTSEVVERAETNITISALMIIITIFIIFVVIKMVKREYDYLKSVYFINQDIFKEKETND